VTLPDRKTLHRKLAGLFGRQEIVRKRNIGRRYGVP